METPNFQVNFLSFVKGFFSHPLYFLEFTFIGLPFFFSQVIVFGIAYTIFWMIVQGGQGSVSFSLDIFIEGFGFNFWLIVIPIAAALLVKIFSKLLNRDLILTWKHWFWGVCILDTLFYGTIIIALIMQGAFQAPNSLQFLGVIGAIYGLTILLALLHFFLYEKIRKKLEGIHPAS